MKPGDISNITIKATLKSKKRLIKLLYTILLLVNWFLVLLKESKNYFINV